MANYMQFRPRRQKLHCSIDVLYHCGVLRITHAVGVSREVRHG